MQSSFISVKPLWQPASSTSTHNFVPTRLLEKPTVVKPPTQQDNCQVASVLTVHPRRAQKKYVCLLLPGKRVLFRQKRSVCCHVGKDSVGSRGTASPPRLATAPQLLLILKHCPAACCSLQHIGLPRATKHTATVQLYLSD
jgi:hypothetical protein